MATHAAEVRGMTAYMSSTTRESCASSTRNGVVGRVGEWIVVASARTDSNMTMTTFRGRAGGVATGTGETADRSGTRADAEPAATAKKRLLMEPQSGPSVSCSNGLPT